MTRDTVQSLWIDNNLSRMERLSITSFLAQGHPYHLYTYSREPMDVPEGAVVCDAREIVAQEDVWTHRFGPALGSYAGFSDYFRYMLLYKKGGIWADADLICLRPLPAGREVMIGSERFAPGNVQASTQLLKFPAGDPLLAELIAACEAISPDAVGFSKIGPELISRVVAARGYAQHRLPFELSCPVHWNNFYRNLLPEDGATVMAELEDEGICCLHLWHELLRRQDMPKDAAHHPNSAYEQLAARFGVAAPQTDPAAVNRFTAKLYLEAFRDPFRVEDHAAARALIERAIETDPGLGAGYLELVRHRREGEAVALRNRLARVAETGGQDAHFHLAQAELAFALNDKAVGREHASNAARLALSGSALALCDVAQSLVRLEEVALACGFLVEGAEVFPDDGQVIAQLARAQRRLGAREAALAGFRKAVTLNPADAIIRANLAEELAVSGAPAEALEEARQAMAQHPVPRVRLALARALVAADEAQEAEESLREILEDTPEERGAAMLLAQLLRDHRRLPDAVEVLRVYMVTSPGDEAAAQFLSRLEARL